MKSSTPLLIATAIAASLSFSVLAPAAYADQGNGGGDRMSQHQGNGGSDRMNQHQGNGQNRGQARGGMFRLVCSDKGAARIEKMLTRLGDRSTLTDEQKPLFEDFKTHALAAQTTFADACTTPSRDGTTTMVDQLKNRQTNMSAMVAAMDEVLPSLETFDKSLTDEQKAQLNPKRGGQQGWRRQN